MLFLSQTEQHTPQKSRKKLDDKAFNRFCIFRFVSFHFMNESDDSSLWFVLSKKKFSALLGEGKTAEIGFD